MSIENLPHVHHIQNSKLKTQNSPLRVSVIIPTRNGAHLLTECLEALWNQTYRHTTPFETLVVDDASTDNTHHLLLGYPEISILTLPGTHGHGFVAAVNSGLERAHGEIIVLLNNDAVPDPDWLSNLIAALDRNPWAGMAASRLMLYSRPDHFHSTGDYYGLDGVPNSRGVWRRDRGQYNREEEVFGPCAAAAAYRRTVLTDVTSQATTNSPFQVLDPQLWMYCEDVDLNLRARHRGHRTVYVPTARVLHRLSATGGGTLSSYYVGRNLIYLIAKNLPLQIILRTLPRIIAAQTRFTLEALRNVRHPASRARLRGIIVGLVTWPRLLPTRKRVLASSSLTPLELYRLLKRFSVTKSSTRKRQ